MNTKQEKVLICTHEARTYEWQFEYIEIEEES